MLVVIGLSGGCDKPAPEQQAAPAERGGAPAGHLTQSQVRPLFPRHLGELALEGFAVKVKTDAWQEYKGTYKGGGKTLKVVINDWLPSGSPAWKELLAKGKRKTQGYPSYLEEKAQKRTLMVRVADRFRVDFKSRDLDDEQIRQAAGDFDLSAVAALGGR